jgi:hypothetical protein
MTHRPPHIISDDAIKDVLRQRALSPDYAMLTPTDVEQHCALLVSLVREKVQRLRGPDHIRIPEALAHALMMDQWTQRNDASPATEPEPTKSGPGPA